MLRCLSLFERKMTDDHDFFLGRSRESNLCVDTQLVFLQFDSVPEMMKEPLVITL